MENRGIVDLAGGAFLALIGLVFLVGSFDYGIGTATEMKAGYFPMVLGGIAAAIGLFIAVSGWSRPDAFPAIPWRPVIAITAALTAFALLIEHAGIIPAAFAAVVLSSLANAGAGVVSTLVLAASVSLSAWALFSIGFGLPIPAFGSLL